MDGLILSEQIADEAAVSRRAFLQGTGLLLGFGLTGASTESVFGAPASRVVENEVTGTFAPNGFIRINPTGPVTLVMPMAEMGQGVYTALSMLLAEELEIGLDQIQVQHRRQMMRFTPTRSCTFKLQVLPRLYVPSGCRCVRQAQWVVIC